jgi:hypothetical protein
MTEQKYRNIVVGLIISGITITIALGSLILGEIYFRNRLENKMENELQKEPPEDIENGSFPLSIGLYTHDGEKFSKDDGNLKLITDPFTIYKNFPNQKTKYWTINSLGFRGREIIPEKKGRKRIIVVGGSAAFGTGVGNDSYTFQSNLENINPDYEVINAGVVGFLSGQELTYIITELVDYKPDIIIAYDGWNDLESQWNHESRFGKKKGGKELGYNANFYFGHIEKNLVENYRSGNNVFYCLSRLINKSILLKEVKTRTNNLISLIRKPNAYQRENLHKEKGEKGEDLYFDNIVKNYTNNLTKISDFCRINNICFLVVFQPELGNKINKTASENSILRVWQLNYASFFPSLYKKFLEESKKILNKNDVNYLDVNSCPELVNSKERLFADVVHANRRGNQIVAHIIDHYLRTSQLSCKQVVSR